MSEIEPNFALEAAVSAGRWVVSETSQTESDQARRGDLYGGGAGVLLFLGRLAEATAEAWVANAANSLAETLLDAAEPRATDAPTGLYSGLGGLAFAFAQQESSMAAAHRAVDELIARPPAPGDCTDIISGTAGYGLSLLWAHRAMARDDTLGAAVVAGDHLRALAEPAPPVQQGLRWRMRPADEYVMPNFSHGTAGVAFFLARLAERTAEDRFLAAAAAGARHLIDVAGTFGNGQLVCHHSPGGETLHYLGWCHGPPGTTRLFLQLDQMTDGPWREQVDALTDGLIAEGIPAVRTEGFWNNVGRCCGDAGVAEFAQDLLELGFDDSRLPALRDACTHNILRAAVAADTPLGEGLSWPHAEHRNRPEQIEASMGLMQGAAGIGLWLLRAAGTPAPRLPDDIDLPARMAL